MMSLSKSRPSESKWVDGVAVAAWYGLRFAALESRFLPAQRAEGRLGVKFLHEVPIFPQLPSRLSSFMGAGAQNPQSEDAFFLNIWSPDQAERLPVLVFIHGGAWMTGGASMPWYDGSRLAAQGVVVVNVSYRLGALGHLGKASDCSLPLPAHDLVLALQWITENIAQFGGDATNITLAGQSAGGWYAHLLSMLPNTEGMIQRVALLSMGTRSPWTLEKQASLTRQTALLTEGGEATSAENMLIAGLKALGKAPFQLGYAPAAFLPVASKAVPDQLFDPAWAAQHSHAKKTYIRYTADECAAFFFDLEEYLHLSQEQVDAALSEWPVEDLPDYLLCQGQFAGAASGLSAYRQVVAASSWRQFQRFPVLYAYELSRLGKSVAVSQFKLESHLSGLYSGHCFDLAFQFGVREAWQDAPMLEGVTDSVFERESKALIHELCLFIKS